MSKHPDGDDRECENDVLISSTGENEDDASISDCLGRLDAEEKAVEREGAWERDIKLS